MPAGRRRSHGRGGAGPRPYDIDSNRDATERDTAVRCRSAGLSGAEISGTVPAMRHIGTLIAAIVIGPLAWILTAYGQDRSAEAFAKAGNSGAFHTGDFVQPLVYLAVAGLLLGLIATLRYSPLGAVLTGVVYVASYVILLIDPTWEMKLFTGNISIFHHTADPRTPVRTGTTLLIGALLLVAVASVGRWRRWPRTAADAGTGADTLIPESPTFTGLPPAGSDLFGSGGTTGGTAGGTGESRSGSTSTWNTGTGSWDSTDPRWGGTVPEQTAASGEAATEDVTAGGSMSAGGDATDTTRSGSTSPWTLPPRERPGDHEG